MSTFEEETCAVVNQLEFSNVVVGVYYEVEIFYFMTEQIKRHYIYRAPKKRE
jgi:hypothetical protein